jgi:4-amino-4-deoxy-L-arabinose transferase-like glycosyltransferase
MVSVLILTLVGQPENPPGFHRDEAGIGYSAYSILKTGKDDWGRFMPLHFKALGDYPPGIYNYLTVFFIALMGLTELAVRMPGIIAAVLLVPLTYKIVTILFKDKRLAVLTSGVMVFSPWFLVQARSSSEPLLALVFVYLGLIAINHWLRTNKSWASFTAFICYFLALFTYNAVKPILFLIHFSFILFVFPQKIKTTKPIVSTLFILIVSFLSVFAIPGAAMNFNGGNIWQKVALESRTAQYTREGIEGVPVFISRAFHNKYCDVILTAIGAAFTYLGTGFLFFGGGNPPRYVIPFTGQLLVLYLPFLIIGILDRSVLDSKKQKLLLLWVFLGVLPGVISINFFPHIKRTMFMYLSLYVWIANGIIIVLNQKKRFLRIGILVSIIIFGIYNFGFFINNYFVHSRYETVYDRSYGYREGFAKLKEMEDEYEHVEVYDYNESPDIFYLFYTQINPIKIQTLADQRTNMFDKTKQSWTLDKYTFFSSQCPGNTEIKPGVLYMSRESCANQLDNKYYQLIDVIKMPDQSVRLMIFRSV